MIRTVGSGSMTKYDMTDIIPVTVHRSYIYLIHPKDQIDAGHNIYKIGKTCQINLKRFTSYPKGSDLLFHMKCNDCDLIEREIIKLFRYKYKPTKIGIEYFEGNYQEMIIDICKLIVANQQDV
jgi:hypothetical protein